MNSKSESLLVDIWTSLSQNFTFLETIPKDAIPESKNHDTIYHSVDTFFCSHIANALIVIKYAVIKNYIDSKDVLRAHSTGYPVTGYKYYGLSILPTISFFEGFKKIHIQIRKTYTVL